MTFSIPIKIYNRYHELGDWVEKFHSFVVSNVEIWCAYRRDVLSANPDGQNTEVWWRRFDLNIQDFVGDAELVARWAEDPRAVNVGSKTYILLTRTGGAESRYTLYDVNEDRQVDLHCPAEPFIFGKNWMPFERGDQLFAVVGFNPFTIVSIDVVEGWVEKIVEWNVGLQLPWAQDGFTQWRGGGSALVEEGHLYGFGHRTLDTDNHRPFYFDYEFDDFGFGVESNLDLDVKGARIIDPTSFFKFRDRYYVGVACSERSWFSAQRFQSWLFEVNFDK